MAVTGNDGVGAVGAQATPLTAVQLEAALLATFAVVSNEGRRDCAYIAVGMASASAVGGDLGAPNLKPGGAIQAQLRQLAAKAILSNVNRYPVEGTHQNFINSILSLLLIHVEDLSVLSNNVLITRFFTSRESLKLVRVFVLLTKLWFWRCILIEFLIREILNT